MLPEYYEKFLAAIDELSPALHETFQTTITQLVSVVQQHGEAALHMHLSSLLQKQEFIIQSLSNEKHLICGRYSTESTKTLLLFSHCPPHPDTFARWSTFVTRLLTFAFYQKTIGSTPINIVWLIDTEEYSENGDAERRFITNNSSILQVNGCLYDLAERHVLPARFLAFGTKGLLNIALEVQTASIGHASTYGAIIPNAASRLLWALSSLKDAREEILVEDFYDTLIPMEDEEIELLRNLLDSEEALKHHLNVDQFLLQLRGFQLQYTYLLLPTCTVTSFFSDEAPSNKSHTIPFRAKATLDVYLVPNQEPDDIYTKIRKHLDTQGFQDIYTEVRVNTGPQYTPSHNPFMQVAIAAISAAYGEHFPLLPLMPQHDACYSFRSQLNIPVAFTQLGHTQSHIYKHATSLEKEYAEHQTQFLINSMKHLAFIIEGIA